MIDVSDLGTVKMNRIFGRKKEEAPKEVAPPVDITAVTGKIDSRVTELDNKVRLGSCTITLRTQANIILRSD